MSHMTSVMKQFLSDAHFLSDVAIKNLPKSPPLWRKRLMFYCSVLEFKAQFIFPQNVREVRMPLDQGIAGHVATTGQL